MVQTTTAEFKTISDLIFVQRAMVKIVCHSAAVILLLTFGNTSIELLLFKEFNFKD